MNRIKTDTIIRTAVLLLALVNNALTLMGRSVLPVSDEQISQLLTLAIMVGASLWAWWKNNSFTKEAIEADEMLAQLRGK